jgi:hypothetical protein
MSVITLNSQLYKDGTDKTAIQIGTGSVSAANSVAIGNTATVDASNAIAIGYGTSAAANAIHIGNNDITHCRIGPSEMNFLDDSIEFAKVPSVDSDITVEEFTLDNHLVTKAYVDSVASTLAPDDDYVLRTEAFKDLGANGINIQLGPASKAEYKRATAVGNTAIALEDSTAVGNNAKTDTSSTAIGSYADGSAGKGNITIGTDCKVIPTNTEPIDLVARSNNIVIGNYSRVEGTNSILIARHATLSKDNAIQIGRTGDTTQNTQTLQLGGVGADISGSAIIFDDIPRVDTDIPLTNFTLNNQLVNKEYVDSTIQDSIPATGDFVLRTEAFKKVTVQNDDDAFNVQLGYNVSGDEDDILIGRGIVSETSTNKGTNIIIGRTITADGNNNILIGRNDIAQTESNQIIIGNNNHNHIELGALIMNIVDDGTDKKLVFTINGKTYTLQPD